MIPMDPDLIRSLLEGRESSIGAIHDRNQEAQDDITSSTCVTCNSALQPRIPSDPSKVFKGTRVQFMAWCPTCEKVSEG